MNKNTIKFRVWRDYGDEGLYITEEEDIRIDQDGGVWQEECDEITDQSTVEWFTGVIDKNGKEIYEGDLVKFTQSQINFGGIERKSREASSCEVVMSPFMAAFVLDPSGRHKLGDSKYGDYIPLMKSWHPNNRLSYEVVGNIHETK